MKAVLHAVLVDPFAEPTGLAVSLAVCRVAVPREDHGDEQEQRRQRFHRRWLLVLPLASALRMCNASAFEGDLASGDTTWVVAAIVAFLRLRSRCELAAARDRVVLATAAAMRRLPARFDVAQPLESVQSRADIVPFEALSASHR